MDLRGKRVSGNQGSLASTAGDKGKRVGKRKVHLAKGHPKIWRESGRGERIRNTSWGGDGLSEPII